MRNSNTQLNLPHQKIALACMLIGISTAALAVDCTNIDNWNGEAAYNAGSQAQDANSAYQAKWWNQNEQPSINSASYQSWRSLGACDTSSIPSNSSSSSGGGLAVSSSFTVDADTVCNWSDAETGNGIINPDNKVGSTIYLPVVSVFGGPGWIEQSFSVSYNNNTTTSLPMQLLNGKGTLNLTIDFPPTNGVTTTIALDNVIGDRLRLVSLTEKGGPNLSTISYSQALYCTNANVDCGYTATPDPTSCSDTAKPLSIPRVPTTAVINKPVSFTGDSSYDPDGTITRYSWDFGDDNSSTLINPTHTFTEIPASGNRYVKLTVTDNTGLVSTSSKTIKIKSSDECAP